MTDLPPKYPNRPETTPAPDVRTTSTRPDARPEVRTTSTSMWLVFLVIAAVILAVGVYYMNNADSVVDAPTTPGATIPEAVPAEPDAGEAAPVETAPEDPAPAETETAPADTAPAEPGTVEPTPGATGGTTP